MIHFKAEFAPEAESIIEELRMNIANGKPMGITVQGHHIVMRWGGKHTLKQVSMVVVDIEDGGDLTECEGCGVVCERKYPRSLCSDCRCPK